MRLHEQLGFFLMPIAIQYLFETLGHLSMAKVPSLTFFSIFLTPNEKMDVVKDMVCSALLNCKVFAGPKLRAVTLGGHVQMPNRPFVKYFEHWTSVTELTIEPSQSDQRSTLFNAYHALQFLQHLPHLTSVSFVLHHEKPGQIVQREHPVTLPNLQKVSLRGVPMGPGFARSLVLPSLTSMYLAFDAYENDGQDPPTLATPAGYGEGILELLRRFGGQFTALAIDPAPFTGTLSSFPSCLDYLDSGRLETFRLIDRHFPAPHPDSQSEEAARRELIHAALVYLANPAVLPNLKHFGMTLWDHSLHMCEGALAEVVNGRRRMEVAIEKDRQEE